MGKIKKEPLSFFDEEQGYCSLADWEAIKPPPLPPQGSDFFYFCCQCETVINPEIVKEKGFCPNCKTASLKNFLCSSCQTILLHFNEEYEKNFFDSSKFCPCPLCKEPINTRPIILHDCKNLISFKTERLYCPSCNQHLRHWTETHKTDNSKPIKTVQGQSINSNKIISNIQTSAVIDESKSQYPEIKNFAELKLEFSEQINNIQTEINQVREQKVEKEEFEKFKKTRINKEQEFSQYKNQIEVLQNKFDQLTENFVSNQSYTTSVLNKFRQELADFKTYLTPIANTPNEKPLVTNEIQNSSSNPPITKYKREDDEDERTIVTSRPLKQSQTNLDLSSVKGLVAIIHERFPDKIPLAKYTGIPEVLKVASSSDTVFYYQVSLSNNNSKIHFAIPSANRINSDGQFRNLADFYSVKKGNTKSLNGKLVIETPTEIKWDEKIQGWRLVNKGEISID
jgi:hypothetical protein